MLNSKELLDMSRIQPGDSYYVSLYLDVNPASNPKGEYSKWFKNAKKELLERLDKQTLKTVEPDLEKMDSYILGNKKALKKGLVIISSQTGGFWREYNISMHLKNELIVERTPYLKPLVDIADGMKPYAVLLVDKENARVFLKRLGEIAEYGQVHTQDVPGKHKKGGWFALSQNHYDRHIEYHVGLHIKEVIKTLEHFLGSENIHRLVIGGAEDAIKKTRSMLPKDIDSMVIGEFNAEMFANPNDVLKRTEDAIKAGISAREKDDVSKLVAKAGKADKAVVGLDPVLRAVSEGKALKLVIEHDYAAVGYQCKKCGSMWARREDKCPYCGGQFEELKYAVDAVTQRAVDKGIEVDIVSKEAGLQRAGWIGAYLRF